jgi:hypothetical protein
MKDTYTCSGWACTDCLMLLANGEAPPDLGEAETAEWLAGIDARNAGYDITLGMPREDHECASNYTVTAADGTTGEYRADSKSDARDQFGSGHGFRGHGPYHAVPHDLETEQDRGGECECETKTFSWSPCDVCDSNLGGARHAVSFFKITD